VPTNSFISAEYVYKNVMYNNNTFTVNIIYNHKNNCLIQTIFDSYDNAINYYNQTFETHRR
jgi:hypothetical protein